MVLGYHGKVGRNGAPSGLGYMLNIGLGKALKAYRRGICIRVVYRPYYMDTYTFFLA
jgi:hypothetical protein